MTNIKRLQEDYSHQTWQVGGLWQVTTTQKFAWPFDHVAIYQMKSNISPLHIHSLSPPQLPDLISWWLDKGSLHIKSYDTLITWSEIATWQKNDISLLPRLWYWPNLIRCWFTTRRCYKKSHMNLWWSRGHVR